MLPPTLHLLQCAFVRRVAFCNHILQMLVLRLYDLICGVPMVRKITWPTQLPTRHCLYASRLLLMAEDRMAEDRRMFTAITLGDLGGQRFSVPWPVGLRPRPSEASGDIGGPGGDHRRAGGADRLSWPATNRLASVGGHPGAGSRYRTPTAPARVHLARASVSARAPRSSASRDLLCAERRCAPRSRDGRALRGGPPSRRDGIGSPPGSCSAVSGGTDAQRKERTFWHIDAAQQQQCRAARQRARSYDCGCRVGGFRPIES